MSFLLLPAKENELVLNTPKRKELLKDGPPLSQIKNNLLGRGAYGTVIKAIYKAKPVAVKIIKNLKDVNNKIMLNESHILGWKHPNIVRILKIESTPNFAIVIMERFNGDCLQTALNTMEIPVMHRIYIAMDIISGLMYCHEKDLLHMDVKPQNVMISLNKPQLYAGKPNSFRRSYICKLCDFGSSLNIKDKKPDMKGSVKGTLRYMAPEALKEECLTPAADIYSLGITLWQMKHRLLPYHWIQCNDIIAYQVVKHQLRPNVTPVIENHHNSIATSQQNQLCETNHIPISPQSLEDLLNILQRTECEIITEPNPTANIPPKRLPLKDLNNNNQNSKSLNVKRDLQNYFTLTETFALATILSIPTHLEVNSIVTLERRYEDIFKSCWHDDFKQRPTAAELSKRFKEML